MTNPDGATRFSAAVSTGKAPRSLLSVSNEKPMQGELLYNCWIDAHKSFTSCSDEFGDFAGSSGEYGGGGYLPKLTDFVILCYPYR